MKIRIVNVLIPAILTILALHAPAQVADRVQIAEAGAWLSEQTASELTAGFTRTYGGVRSHLYSAARVLQLLDPPGTAGLRLWHGEAQGSPAFVLVGVDAQNQDHLQGPWLDDAEECPPHCPTWQLAPPLEAARAGRMLTRREARRLTRDYAYEVDGVRGHLFSARRVRELLESPGAAGLRIYYGRQSDDARVQLVLVATDAEGFDLPGSALGQGEASLSTREEIRGEME